MQVGFVQEVLQPLLIYAHNEQMVTIRTILQTLPYELQDVEMDLEQD